MVIKQEKKGKREMKVIDLLNKIANGEEVPKKIAIQNEALIYNEDEILNLQDCYYMTDEEDATWRIWAYELNDEVEIIEEEKKMPEKLEGFRFKKETDDLTDEELEIENYLSDITDKINEIIDYLKSKGD